MTATAPVEDPEKELPKMSFLEHLEELRKRLVYALIALIVAFLACWNFADRIFTILERPLAQFLPHGDKLVYTRLTEPFMLYMKVAFYTGIFVASPFLLLQIWLFIAPGLYARERRYAAPFILIGSALFIAGGYFGYSVILPATCSFFVETGKHFQQMLKADDFFSFASTIILATGVVFETPILIFFLARLGIVTPAFLMQKWQFAVVGSVVISAIITPTPDMITCLAVACPMIALYFIGVLVAWMFGRKKGSDL